jgi:hypothetical protein
MVTIKVRNRKHRIWVLAKSNDKIPKFNQTKTEFYSDKYTAIVLSTSTKEEMVLRPVQKHMNMLKSIL